MTKTILVLFSSALALQAQKPAFEAAVIKPNRSIEGVSSIRGSEGRLTMSNVSLRKVTLWAYGIPDDREYALVGPGWLATERFDIQATFPAGSGPEDVRQMTQTLLAERFQLKLHRETKESSIYALVVVKNGPRIHPVEDGQGQTRNNAGHFEATKTSMAKFAELLGRFAGQPVVDATDLKDVFDFTLDWSPDDRDGVFMALQEKLGLKLEGRKGPVEVLVVDHMEKTPTEN